MFIKIKNYIHMRYMDILVNHNKATRMGVNMVRTSKGLMKYDLTKLSYWRSSYMDFIPSTYTQIKINIR